MSEPIAVAISDLHLSLLQPVCRADKDWMDVQALYLQQVRRIANGLPILCAGDIFDRWNAPPELINFALKHLPHGMICVPGQHDLPNHRIDQVHRSGYGVLKTVGHIEDLSTTGPGDNDYWIAYGFGWGQEIKPLLGGSDNRLQIALIHRYCWTEDKKYPDAPDESNIAAFKKQLKGYNVAIFGDNHKSFITEVGGCVVLNVGGFIRRKSDEIDYQPSVGIIYDDGTVKRKKLDTTIDIFHDSPEDRKEIPLDMKAFIDGLESLGEHGLNFREAVENHLRTEEIDQETKELILKSLEITKP